MRPLIVCLLLAGICVSLRVSAAHAQYFPQHMWSHRIGDTGTETAYDVAVDLDIRTLVVGSFEGTIDPGGGPLVSAGSTDAFVAVFEPDGTHIWSRRFGGTGADAAYGVAAEAHYLGGGNWIYEYTVTGSFEDTVNFGGNDLVSAGGSDGFVVRLDGAGSHLWSTRFGDAGNDVGYAITRVGAPTHDVTVTGSVTDTQPGTKDIFLARYDATGAQPWSHTFGGPLDDVGRSISGGFVTGEFRDQASLGGSPLVSAGGSDIFVARYDNSGAHLWSQRFGGTQDDAGLAVAGNYCTGYIRGTVDFGSGNLTSAGGEDIFLLKLDANGLYQYARRYGGTGNDAGKALDVSGLIAIVGRFENSVYFGHETLTSAGGSDGFLALFRDDGLNPRNVRMGGPGNDTANAIQQFPVFYVPEAGGYDFSITGAFSDTVDLGGGPLVSAGDTDAFAVYYSERWITPVGRGLPGDRLSIASYPNPFNPMTTVRYSVPTDGPVTLSIYGVNGDRIATLLDRRHQTAGAYEVQWHGRTDGGLPVASGVYFAQVEHAGATETVRLVMLK